MVGRSAVGVPRMATALLHRALQPPTVRCLACGGMGVVTGVDLRDESADPGAWPQVPCVFTPGCRGRTAPDCLN